MEMLTPPNHSLTLGKMLGQKIGLALPVGVEWSRLTSFPVKEFLEQSIWVFHSLLSKGLLAKRSSSLHNDSL